MCLYADKGTVHNRYTILALMLGSTTALRTLKYVNKAKLCGKLLGLSKYTSSTVHFQIRFPRNASMLERFDMPSTSRQHFTRRLHMQELARSGTALKEE
jgi:hypothetical protein